jgi:hypothetical protein
MGASSARLEKKYQHHRHDRSQRANRAYAGDHVCGRGFDRIGFCGARSVQDVLN